MNLSYEQRFKRSLKITVPLYVIALIIDLAVIFIGYRAITPDKFIGMFAIFGLFISLPIGLGCTLISCLATKNSWNGRHTVFIMTLIRCVLLLIAAFVGVTVNKMWSYTPTGTGYGYTAGTVIVAGLVLFVGQFFACVWFIENFRAPKNEKLYEAAEKIPYTPTEYKPDPRTTPSKYCPWLTEEEWEKFKQDVDNY